MNSLDQIELDKICLSDFIESCGYKISAQDILHELAACDSFIEPLRPQSNEHFQLLRECTEIEKKLHTLMVQKKAIKDEYQKKLDQVDQKDLAERYITKPLYKNDIFIGNVHILKDKKSEMRPFLEKLRSFYLQKYRDVSEQWFLYKMLLVGSINTVRPSLHFQQREKDIYYCKGFVLEVIKVCLPGKTWVTFAGEWQCV